MSAFSSAEAKETIVSARHVTTNGFATDTNTVFLRRNEANRKRKPEHRNDAPHRVAPKRNT